MDPVSKFDVIQSSDIIVLDLIGEGSTAMIMRGLYKGNLVAIKRANSDKYSEQNIKEYEMLKDLDHPNIIKPIGIVMDDIVAYSIVFPLYDGSLYDLYEHNLLDEDMQKEIIRQIIPALVDLRSKNISHNDIILNNIFYLYKDDTYHFIVADFGEASYRDPSETYNKVYYAKWYPGMDPILWTSRGNEDIKDIWIFIWDLFPSFKDIFYSKASITKSNEILFMELMPAMISTIEDPLLKDLISRTLSFDFDNRLSWHNILDHPFFHGE